MTEVTTATTVEESQHVSCDDITYGNPFINQPLPPDNPTNTSLCIPLTTYQTKLTVQLTNKTPKLPKVSRSPTALPNTLHEFQLLGGPPEDLFSNKSDESQDEMKATYDDGHVSSNDGGNFWCLVNFPSISCHYLMVLG